MASVVARGLARIPSRAQLREFLSPPQYAGARLTLKKLANLYLNRWEEARGTVVMRSRPIRLTVEASNICNLRCPACFTGVGEHGRKRSSMPLDLYLRVLDELGDYLFSVDFFNWGEPLLAKQIDTMVAEATRRGIASTVSTNFSFPYDAGRAEGLVRAGLGVLGVSIDGASQPSYEKYRVRGDIARVIDNCRLVQDAKRRLGSTTPRLVWEYHVFEHNVDEIETARVMAAELGMDIAVTKGWTVGEEWDPQSEHRFFWYPTPPARCRFPWQDAVIHNDGGVAPCCGTFYKEDDVGELPMQRNGRDGAGFRAVWNGAGLREARALFNDRAATGDHVCKDCPITVIWERWQQHLVSGAPGGHFDPGFGTNDCFNYFWNRRPQRTETEPR